VFEDMFAGQAELAAFGVNEMVDENMANAARVHAVESGKDAATRVLIAFGGAAPLHACRVAERIGISRVLVPTSAGVGSAVGFLRAPVAYEVTRSLPVRLSRFDADLVNRVLGEMAAEARAVVEAGALGRPLVERLTAYMRYVGQGHEVVVPLEPRRFSRGDAASLAEAFEARHQATYGRSIPGLEAEVLHWSIVVSTAEDKPAETRRARAPKPRPAKPGGTREVYDPDRAATAIIPVFERAALRPGAEIEGPAIIVEDETSTVLTTAFACVVDERGFLDCRRRETEVAP
jgi:N-methylhydantoinase A